MSKRSCLAGWLIAALLLGACQSPARNTGTLNTLPPRPTVASPTAAPLPLPTQTPTPDPEAQRTRYHLVAELDASTRQLTVTEKVHYTNHSSGPLSDLELLVEANAVPGVFELDSVTREDGSLVTDYSLDGVKLVLPLVQSLQSGQSANFSIFYTIQLPRQPGVLSFSDEQINLAGWYPYLPPYEEGTGWLLHEPGSVGEYQVYEKANFDVTINVSNAAADLIAAAPVPNDANQPGQFHFSAEGRRNFALSLGSRYMALAGISGQTTVTVYVLTGDESAGEACLSTTMQALSLYSELYGSYPYKTLSAVEAEFEDGMEYDGLYFIGSEYFAGYSGQALSYLEMISAHETAHQWAYAAAASDQALEPWLDEALAAYSEELYFEHYHPDQVDGWWQKRVDFYAAQGAVNSTIYDFTAFRPYVNAVYLRGAEMLRDLRGQMGDDAFFIFLKDYFAEGSASDTKIMHASDFWDMAEKVGGGNLRDRFAEYFVGK
jgi:hypothetical protein